MKGGHRLNSLVLKALLEDTSAWSIVQAPRVRQARSNGFERQAVVLPRAVISTVSHLLQVTASRASSA